MALSTLLEITSRATDELGLPRQTAIVSATTVDARQYLSLLNSAGRDLMKSHDWGDLMGSTTVITVSGTSDYAVPSDYDRMVSDTHWNRTNSWRLPGPISPQADRELRESGIVSSIRYDFRQIGKTYVRLTPTPTVSNETLVYEYVSNKWARSSGAVAQYEFLADTDTSVFDANLMVKELKWRYFAAKGFDASILRAERDELLDQIISGDVGGTKIDLGPDLNAGELLVPSITDGSWSI